jgi:hypothetical protein
VTGGAAVTTLEWTPAPALAWPTPTALLAISTFAVLAYVAYGVDLPKLNARFSRLV